MERRKREVPPAPPDCATVKSRRVRVTYPYGFVDEDGTHRFWRAGTLVHDIDELALLRARGVDLEEE